MIGLGSNRLTVCRRGGMSVTQAGRGGMEWLAGGRGVSPYSAQATAALKAQFPTQWPTIRDYGFSHPEIVPYVNIVATTYIEEDPYTIYSLIPTLGKRRWLANNGNNAYVRTGLMPKTNSTVKITYKTSVNSTTYPFVFGAELASRTSRFGTWSTTSTIAPRFGSWSENIARTITGKAVTVERRADGKGYIDGEYRADSVIQENIGFEVYLYAMNDNGRGITSDGAPMNGAICEFEMDGHMFIPIRRNNVMEWIDLTTGTLATRVGTLTEEIETISS